MLSNSSQADDRRRRETFLAVSYFAAPLFTAGRELLAAARVAAVGAAGPARPGGETPSPEEPAPAGRERDPDVTRPHPWTGTPPPPMPDGTPWP